MATLGKRNAQLALIVVAMCVASCALPSGSDEERPPAGLAAGALLRDSGGARIADFADILANEWHVDENPIRIVGVKSVQLDAHSAFWSAAWLDDTTYTISDGRQALVFGPNGRLRAQFKLDSSKTRKAPGIRQVCVLGKDSLAALAYSGQKVTVFSANGRVLEHRSTAPSMAHQGCTSGGIVAAFAGDSNRLAIDVVTQAGQRSRLGVFPAPYYGRRTYETQVASGLHQIAIADPRRFAIRWYSVDGTLTAMSRVWARPKEVELTGPNAPKFAPAFGKIIGERSGRIWVQDAAASTRWYVLQPGDTTIGRIDLAAGAGLSQSLIAADSGVIVVREQRAARPPVMAFYRIRQ